MKRVWYSSWYWNDENGSLRKSLRVWWSKFYTYKAYREVIRYKDIRRYESMLYGKTMKSLCSPLTVCSECYLSFKRYTPKKRITRFCDETQTE